MVSESVDDDIVVALRAAGCVYAEDEAALLRGAAESAAQFTAMVAQRVSGLPLEQVVGWAEFCGLRIRVLPGVFVPRRRTEFLVRQALVRVHAGATVVDLCCGSGAIGAAMLAGDPSILLYACDLDPAEVECARLNLPPDRVFLGDLYAALPGDLRGRLDVLVVNAPYVPSAEVRLMPPEAREHEHRIALDGGADGLELQRRVIAGAADWLAPDGCLLIETSARQAPHTAAAMTTAGLVVEVARAKELDATVATGTMATQA